MTTTDADSSPLVSTAWLAAHLDDPAVRIVDVRWRSRYENGRGISLDDRDGYLAGHVPGAVFAGMISDLSDPQHPVPDMLVGPEQFARAMGRLGIGDDTLVVAYDNMGFPLGSARLWWALSHYGHDRVRVLDGGLRAWQAEGRPLSTTVPALVDATAEERERVLSSGRSFSFAAPATLAGLYGSAGVSPGREVIAYCGRGYAAACGLLALKILGHERVRLYDGSWAEWSADPDLPAEIGPG